MAKANRNPPPLNKTSKQLRENLQRDMHVRPYNVITAEDNSEIGGERDFETFKLHNREDRIIIQDNKNLKSL